MRSLVEPIRSTHPEGGRMMTKQAGKDAANINSIMKRWISHGIVTVSGSKPFYGDFSESVSFHDASNRLLAAKESFGKLPADLRKHCNNDPGAFLDLVADPERRAELEEFDLVPELVPDIPVVPPVVPASAVPEPEAAVATEGEV